MHSARRRLAWHRPRTSWMSAKPSSPDQGQRKDGGGASLILGLGEFYSAEPGFQES